MAEKRMFSLSIIDSDAFLDMPSTTQNLYYHLGMRADDDGFINSPKKIMRSIRSSDDDMNLLIAKKFIIIFDNGVVVIKHWKINNYIRSDRYKPTNYQNEFRMLEIEENGSYKVVGIPSGYQVGAQNRLDKIRLDKDSNTIGQKLTDVDTLFNQFWLAYPKKVGKDKCIRWFKSHKVNQEFVDDLLIAIENQKQSKQWQKDKGQFIPHPYTWLNRGGWQDELDGNSGETIKNRWGEFLDD